MGRGQQDWQRVQRQLEREAEQQRKAEERQRAAAARAAQQARVERARAHAARRTRLLEERVAALENVLRAGVRGRQPFVVRRRSYRDARLDLGSLAAVVRPPDWSDFAPPEPGALTRLFGGSARHDRRVEQQRARYADAVRTAEAREVDRQRQVAALRAEHRRRADRDRADVDAGNQQVDEMLSGVGRRDKAGLERYLGLVLSAVPLPEGFPRRTEVAVDPTGTQAVVRAELPAKDVVPAARAYSYVASAEEERESTRPVKEAATLYRSVVSQTALLTIRDLFAADDGLQSVAFNGHLRSIDPATGEPGYPCLTSVEAAREQFPTDERLLAVTPDACLRHLGAIVSPHPYEVEPVEPILDFDLSRFRFVDGLDAVSTLDARPDLLQMSPTNFEHLVRQLFEAQGAEGWTTSQSNDDGVDAVIARRTPLFGGLSIVQAKRYAPTNAIGPAHLRELAGAMEEKKAGWGVLVTTSRFTSGCQQRAREHGRMELVDGANLVHLIKQHLGKDVLIGTTAPRSPRR